MAVWLRLRSIYRLEKNGIEVQYHPGDWVEVSKTQAIYLQSTGIAEIPLETAYKHLSFGDAGIVLTDLADSGRFVLRTYPGRLQIVEGDPEVKFGKTLIWDPSAPVNVSWIPPLLNLLEVWDMAVPLLDHELLAQNIFDEETQEHLLRYIPDLRIPVYDSRLLAVSKTDETEELIELWLDHQNSDGLEPNAALIIAVHKIKPKLLTLPPHWIRSNASQPVK